MMLIIGGGFLIALAYLLGSIPFGLVLTRLFTPIDIRETGSGNIGATNVRRLAGNLLGFLTLFGDVMKGFLPVLLAMAVFRGEPPEFSRTLLSVVAVSAFIGHLFPIYLGFKAGGKGVATALGGCLAISPLAVLFFLAVFGTAVKITRRVSVGSLAGTVFIVPAVWFTTGSVAFLAGTLGMAIFIFIRHRDNLKRLYAGTEPTLDGRPTPERVDT